MKLLVLGGRLFLGRHIVQAALDRRHAVTLFNRGHTCPELFPDAEKRRGDRAGDLQVLWGRTWDAVIDTCGYSRVSSTRPLPCSRMGWHTTPFSPASVSTPIGVSLA
jgi:nucleoside-diphosphate-sugar epimerase